MTLYQLEHGWEHDAPRCADMERLSVKSAEGLVH